MRVRLQYKPKPNNYTESFAVNKADIWRERTCEYPGRPYEHSQYDRIFVVVVEIRFVIGSQQRS